MKIKTSELTGAALDWAVAKIEYPNQEFPEDYLWMVHGALEFYPFNPSSDWAQGGPIIEREGISIEPIGTEDFDYDFEEEEEIEADAQINGWHAFHMIKGGRHHSDESPLVAAMRCYVASKLGGEAEVPDELTTGKEKG